MNRLVPVYFIISLMLSSCGIYGNEFDCRAGGGVGCASLSQVNYLVNEDFLDEYIEVDNNEEYTEKVNRLKNERKLRVEAARNYRASKDLEKAQQKKQTKIHKQDVSTQVRNQYDVESYNLKNKKTKTKEKVTVWIKNEQRQKKS